MNRPSGEVQYSPLLPPASAADWQRLRTGDLSDPHRLLGAHPAAVGGRHGLVVRAYHPDACGVQCLLETSTPLTLPSLGEGGLFAAFLANAAWPVRYRLRFHFPNGDTWERDDPYRFAPTLGDLDLHLFNEGSHRRLWEKLGAHVVTIDRMTGVAFAVWAPNAQRVSVVGDFCRWDGRLCPMRLMGRSGVFELFVPGAAADSHYKFELKTAEGQLRLKSDPFASYMELPPATASRVFVSSHQWKDDHWMQERSRRDALRSPLAIYEVHLGSWRRVPEEHNRWLTYRELAPLLVDHVKSLHFTHVELTPVAEHPFGGSWGYQVTGYYAPTARYGNPDDLRFLVDYCHENHVGVILDWVPAHFPRDDFALRRFDGTALYEHEDPRQGEHPDWGTLIFNYSRHEVRNFLLANALYWLKEFHMDGLRVDAVASMLYLDYSRRPGEWTPNAYGGKENLEAIALLREVNDAVHEECPGCLMIAEESTGWSGVTRPTREHGLGFDFKWNRGWMHDTLLYFSKDSVHRKYHQNDLTFAMLYEHSEHFINPLSHDEVVHGKRSLLEKMPGDDWQRFANLRCLLAYQYTRPGKKLLFMGTELAPHGEWYYEVSLDWHLADHSMRKGLSAFLQDMGRIYVESPCLWQGDPDGESFFWIDCEDWEQSILSYVRQHANSFYIVVLNLTPVPRDGYRIGAPRCGTYRVVMSTDDVRFGGSGYPTIDHRQPQSLVLRLPPLAALILAPA
ncbi:MAG: 1,4-alpha-glucan-branching enzyme [Chloroflexi bacterium]|nr:1,4-alpha-glucan-branching enzyme [Chloroflexota bacterium]